MDSCFSGGVGARGSQIGRTGGGRVRILSSLDGKRWRHVTVLDAGEGRDLRDPKLSVTADKWFPPFLIKPMAW